MKSSRTSTKKKAVKKPVNNIKKVSTSPSRTSTKPIKKSNTNKKQVVKKPVNKQNSNVKRNTHNPQNNIRLNKVNEDIDYVPFFDEENMAQEIIPNRVRKVEPEYKNNNSANSKKSSIKPIVVLKITFFIAIIVGIVYLMFTLETFNLTKIRVTGNDKYSENEILAKCDLKIGENVFKELFKNSKKIDLSYVSKTSYSYIFPNEIKITVNERYPAYVALDKNTKKYYKIDNEGYILEECELSQKKDEILVEGFVLNENIEFGKQINEIYIKKLEIYSEIKKLLTKYEIKGNITNVNFSNSLTIIYLDDKLKIVFSNDSNLEYKVSFLKSIIQKNGGQVEGTIDMSIENPVYSKYN